MEKTALWQAANEALVLIATRGGPTMLARIGGMRALHRHVVHEFNPDHKGAHWGSRSGTNSRFPVSSLQQLVCSFEGTKILVRPVRSPVQFSNDRGRRGHFRKQAILSPAGRWILPGCPFAPILSGDGVPRRGKILIEGLQFSLENSCLLGSGRTSTGAENRTCRLRRGLHRIDLGRQNRDLTEGTSQTCFLGHMFLSRRLRRISNLLLKG
jgi:hypothetical protein